jgi:hypothetical protein
MTTIGANITLNPIVNHGKLYFDFILLIFNCKKYEYKATKQKQTWLKDFTAIPFFHVRGDPLLLVDFYIDYHNNLLWVKTLDDYNSLPKKVIAAYKAMSELFVFKYIFKTDDDQNLISINFLKTLQSLLLETKPRIHYGGHLIKVERAYLSQYYRIHPELPTRLPVLATKYCSGRFYFLSDLAVNQLIDTKTELIDKEYLEDYAIGYHLDEIFKTNLLNLDTNKHFVDFSYYEDAI